MSRFFSTALLLAVWWAAKAQPVLHAPLTTTPYLKTTAYSHRHADAFSFTTNQAALAYSQKGSAGMYSERRYMLQDLSLVSFAGVLPTGSGNFGCSLDYFGSAAYSEAAAGLAYGRKLGGKIAAGVRFSYHYLNAGAYGAAATVTAGAGLLVRLTEQLEAGIQVSNPAGGRLGKKGEEKLPALYTLGLGYTVSDQLCFTALVEKWEGQPVAVTAGLQYQPVAKLFCRIGVATAPASYYFGGGVALRFFRLHAVATVQQQLGVTPGLLLLFQPAAQK